MAAKGKTIAEIVTDIGATKTEVLAAIRHEKLDEPDPEHANGDRLRQPGRQYGVREVAKIKKRVELVRTLVTLTTISDSLMVRRHTVRYAMDALGIKPITISGVAALYSQKQVEQVTKAIKTAAETGVPVGMLAKLNGAKA